MVRDVLTTGDVAETRKDIMPAIVQAGAAPTFPHAPRQRVEMVPGSSLAHAPWQLSVHRRKDINARCWTLGNAPRGSWPPGAPQ